MNIEEMSLDESMFAEASQFGWRRRAWRITWVMNTYVGPSMPT